MPSPLEECVQRPPCSLRLLHHLMDQACGRHLTTGVRWKGVELGCLEEQHLLSPPRIPILREPVGLISCSSKPNASHLAHGVEVK